MRPGLSPYSAELRAANIGLGDAEHARMALAAAIPHYARAVGLLVSQRAPAEAVRCHASLGLCLTTLNHLDDADHHADIATGRVRLSDAPKREVTPETVAERKEQKSEVSVEVNRAGPRCRDHEGDRGVDRAITQDQALDARSPVWRWTSCASTTSVAAVGMRLGVLSWKSGGYQDGLTDLKLSQLC